MYRFFLFAFLFTLPLAISAQNDWKGNISVQIDSILSSHPLMKNASCGVMVYDAQTDDVIYQHDHKKIHRPASTTKIFTCAAALKYLSAEHAIRTSILTNGKIKKEKIDGKKKHVLRGDIFVKGGFDPSFSKTDLDSLVSELRSYSIDTIIGNVYVDVSMKNKILGGNGWCWDDKGDDFPLLSPLLVDKDTTFMSQLLKQLPVSCSVYSDSICPDACSLLAEKCISLGELLTHCLKTSDNRYAESILYQIGTLSGLPYPSTKIALGYVNEMIENFGCAENEYRFVDGSGLSFYNYVTPEMEVALLKYIYKESDFFEIFKSALPISSVDGTLKNRMKGTAAEGKVFAKTGSLTGTYALAGYTENSDGHVLIFSIMNDGTPYGQGNEIRKLQDTILDVLCR